MTTLTPPPAAPLTQPDSLPPQGPRASSTVVAVILIVLGGLIIVGAVIGAVFSTVGSAAVSTQTRTIGVAGIDALDVELNAGSLVIEYDDVDEAELEVTSVVTAERWTFERNGDTLELASPRWEWGFPWMLGGSGSAVLRLPESAQGISAELDLAAGSLTAGGQYENLDVNVGAGELELSGSADTVIVRLSAGGADVDLEDVSTADLSVSAGSMDAEFSGSTPEDIRIDVSAGSLRLVVPEGDYRVTSEVSAGELRNDLGTVPGADSAISVQVSAGEVVLRSTR